MSTPRELRVFLRPYPRAVRELMLDARLALLKVVGPASDLLFDATSAVCAGFSYTGAPRDNFVNLAAFADHVTLVFPWGVKLADPKGLLQGKGNQVRHLRLHSVNDLKDPAVVKLVRQAARQALRPDTPLKPRKYVKIYAGPKRRPGTVK